VHKRHFSCRDIKRCSTHLVVRCRTVLMVTIITITFSIKTRRKVLPRFWSATYCRHVTFLFLLPFDFHRQPASSLFPDHHEKRPKKPRLSTLGRIHHLECSQSLCQIINKLLQPHPLRRVDPNPDLQPARWSSLRSIQCLSF